LSPNTAAVGLALACAGTAAEIADVAVPGGRGRGRLRQRINLAREFRAELLHRRIDACLIHTFVGQCFRCLLQCAVGRLHQVADRIGCARVCTGQLVADGFGHATHAMRR
jgi:hypothetical protein